MNTPQEEHDDTSLPGRFHNGDRFEIAGDSMTRTDGRWSCSCGQIHDDEQVQVDLADGSGVLVEAPNVPSVEGAREARYAEAIRRSPNGVWMTLPGPTDIAPSFARAVLPLVDAEVAAAVSEAQAEVERLRLAYEGAHKGALIYADRWRTLEAGIRALADEWAARVPRVRALGKPMDRREANTWDVAVYELRRALLTPSPAATTGEARVKCPTCPGWGGWHQAGCPARSEPIPAPVSSGEAGGWDVPRANAWDEGYIAGADDARRPGRMAYPDDYAPNPYRPAPVVTPSAEGAE